MHHLMGLVPPDQSALSLGRPLCVRRPQDCKIKQGRYRTTPLANRCEILSPRLTRLGSGAREARRLLGLAPASCAMTRLQPDTIRPECQKCGTQMLLARVEPDSPGRELRTFECPVCKHSEHVVANIE